MKPDLSHTTIMGVVQTPRTFGSTKQPFYRDALVIQMLPFVAVSSDSRVCSLKVSSRSSALDLLGLRVDAFLPRLFKSMIGIAPSVSTTYS